MESNSLHPADESQNQRDSDVHDAEKDILNMREDETTIDLPDVKDIPGQEHVTAPNFTEFADTTISSADEEGDGLFDDNELAGDDDGDVTPTERSLLHKSAVQSPNDEDELDVEEMSLDSADDDGEPLNESNLAEDRFGEDLDMPESEEMDDEAGV